MRPEDILAELNEKMMMYGYQKEDEFSVADYQRALGTKGVKITRRCAQDKLTQMIENGFVTRRMVRFDNGHNGYAYKFTKH